MKFNNKNYLWNSVDLEKITNGNSSAYWECKGIEIDSRKVRKGDLFFPLPGKKLDGHNFIKEAIDRGAEATLIKKGFEENNSEFNNLIVEDVIESLYRLAKESITSAKKLYNTTFVAITGSSGKSSTKEIMRKACNSVVNAYANPDSYNNHIGVPYSLANIPRHTNCAILELGMNNFDEIKKLSILIKPFISIITNISSAHIGNFNSIQDIVKAKSEIFYGMDKSGFAILNRDQKFYKFIKDIASKEGIKNIITFGENKNSDVYLRSRKILNVGQALEVSVFGKTYIFEINIDGAHQAQNCLSVIAALKVMDYDMEKALTGLSNIDLLPGRGIKHKIYINNQESWLIDDTYNANPSSVEASLKSLKELSKGNRNVLVIGDMRELGNFSKELHQTIANLIIKLNTTLVFCVGYETQVIYKSIKNDSQAYWFKEISEMKKENYIDLLEPSDFILIKGSRAMKMEKLVKYTINNFNNKDL